MRAIALLPLLAPALALAHPQQVRTDLDALFAEAEVAVRGHVVHVAAPYGVRGPQLVTVVVERILRGPVEAGALTFLTAVEHGDRWRAGDAAIFLLRTRRFDRRPGFGATALREEMLHVRGAQAAAAEAWLLREPGGAARALRSGVEPLVRHVLARLPGELDLETESALEALAAAGSGEARAALDARAGGLSLPGLGAGLVTALALLWVARRRRPL